MWTVQTQRQILNVMTSLCLIMMLAWLGALQSYSDHFDDSRADAIIERERKHIEEEFAGLETGDFLANNIIDQGGEPVRAMLVTSWRSGSTFLGDILYSHPGTFYHYEPLGYNDIVQVRSGTRAKYATHTLENLMHCNYKSLGKESGIRTIINRNLSKMLLDLYMKAAKIQHWMHSHNTRLYGHCNLKEGDQSVCEDPEFLSRFCSLYPYQLTKTVRLRLNLTQYLVSDPSLNVKVLYLVRDPRGTLESRKHRAWCHGAPDCEDPSHLCQDLVSDYHAYKRLSRMHPGRFKYINSFFQKIKSLYCILS